MCKYSYYTIGQLFRHKYYLNVPEFKFRENIRMIILKHKRYHLRIRDINIWDFRKDVAVKFSYHLKD